MHVPQHASFSLSSFPDLPLEVLEHLFAFFDARSLARLAQCSRSTWNLVEHHGWPAFGRAHLFFHSITNTPRFKLSRWADRARIATSIDDSWHRFRNVSCDEFASFPGRTMPVIRLQEDSRRLTVAGGSSLSTFTFSGNRAMPVEETHLRPMNFRDADGRIKNAWLGRTPTDDITAIAPIEGTGDFVLSHLSGLLQKCRIAEDRQRRPMVVSVSRYSHPKRTIQALDAIRSGVMVCATYRGGGSISMYQSRTPWIEPFTWTIKTKPWSLMLDPDARWLALGHSGAEPLAIYELDQTGRPVDIHTRLSLVGNSVRTAVYGFATPPPSSPIGGAGQTIVSGWFDGSVRIYDLRKRKAKPVLELADPYADAAIYSVACGGGAGCTVAAGTARHGLVQLWDIRRARQNERSGHSLFGPGKDSSPVYGLQMEHDRLFAATDRRAYMLEFGSETKHSGGHPQERNVHTHNTHGMTYGRQDSRRAHGYNDRLPGKLELYYYKHTNMNLKRVC